MTTPLRLYNENYYALVVSILREVPVERAFKLMQDSRAQNRRGFSEEDIREMIQLKENGDTFDAIGFLFGAKANTVYATIRRYNQRQEKKKASGGSH
jgi:hypothetical protein